MTGGAGSAGISSTIVDERTTTEVVRGCRAGDRQAWSTVVDRYENLLLAIGRRSGLSPEDAADLSQVAFLELVNHIDDIRDAERLGSWLATIARRQAWRVRDERRAERDRQIDAEPAEPDQTRACINHVLLSDAMHKLCPQCKKLLAAIFLRTPPATYAEVAVELDQPIGSISSMRSRCLAELRELMTDGAA